MNLNANLIQNSKHNIFVWIFPVKFDFFPFLHYEHAHLLSICKFHSKPPQKHSWCVTFCVSKSSKSIRISFLLLCHIQSVDLPFLHFCRLWHAHAQQKAENRNFQLAKINTNGQAKMSNDRNPNLRTKAEKKIEKSKR